MEWLDLQFAAELPLVGPPMLDLGHNPWLLVLAFALVWAASHATLGLLASANRSTRSHSRRIRRRLGACCLAGAMASVQLIAWLAHYASPQARPDPAWTLTTLLLPVIAAALVLHALDRRRPRAGQYLLAASSIGLGMALMHYSGTAALAANAAPHDQPWSLALATLLAIAGSLGALILGLDAGQATPATPPALKACAPLLLGLALAAVPLTLSGLADLLPPSEAVLPGHSADNHGQLALIISAIALFSIIASLCSFGTNRPLPSDKHDPRRINNLLDQLDNARASLQRVAQFDALTNLLNRQGLNQAFAEKLQEHTQQKQPLAVMFFDLDHFKRINESLGHSAGDELLRVVVERVRRALRDQDVLARFGGDEFCVLASLNDRDEARPLALRMLQCMREPFLLAGRGMVITISIGISLFPEDGQSSDELLKHADLALYQAKSSGRNNLQFFSPQLKGKASRELQLEEELRNALHQDQGLLLYYQPILDLHSGELNKLEALVRWQHPEHGLLSPERFIGIAEANGFVAELDAWVLRRACRDLSLLSDSGYPELRVAVNCSALNLEREELVLEVHDALSSFAVLPQRLELEVTENALMGNINRAAGLLQKIRALGVSLSIDDFGTGYSSLAYLKRLPLDTLKIDRSFLMDIPASQTDMEIIQAIIAMAHALHLKVVAEGVESPQQLAFLREHDCDFVQGYLLSRPLPLQQLELFLQRYRTPSEEPSLLPGQG